MIKKIVNLTSFILFCVSILLLSVRGLRGNPVSDVLDSPKWKDEGPFELSPERGRFALTYSLVEDRSFNFSLPIARFATPDLGYKDGKFVSLFAPGLSFLIAPGYILGRGLGLAQVGTFLVISLFALLNVIVLRLIAIHLGADRRAASLGALVFLFATPAFPYAVSLYQHHVSTFLILASIYLLLRFRNVWSLALIWFMCAASITIDNPNLFLMLPIGLSALARLVVVKRGEQSLKVNIKLAGVLSLVTVVLPVAFFLWFNQASYGDPLQLSGTVSAVKEIDDQGRPESSPESGKREVEGGINSMKRKKSAVGFFRTRNLLNGFYIHFTSPDRGILLYTPVVLFGVLGAIRLGKKNSKALALLLAVVGLNILLYSMWGDPYGGWAFGSRYLIPTYALMAILIALVLNSWGKNIFFVLLFTMVMYYSVWVNALGAITTSRNPPKVEAVALEKVSGVEEKYTWERNYDYLQGNRSKSLVFRALASRYLTAWQYHLLITFLVMVVSGWYAASLVYWGKIRFSPKGWWRRRKR